MRDSTDLERRRATSRASYHRRKQPPVLSDHPCECGCGQFTFLAPRTSAEKGWIKGEPQRFVRGHNRRRYHGPVPEARCRLCKLEKPAEEFYADKARPNGLSSACRECIKAKKRADYKANPEPFNAQAKQWRKDNPGRTQQLGKRWRKNNPQRYKDSKTEREHRRRVRLRNGIVEKIDPQAIYERDGGRCHICGKHVARKAMSLDHLTPISKGGDHVALNVRLAHLSCNIERGVDRIPAQLLLQ